MAYRLATSLTLLRTEINTRWPDRDKVSDGWVGDAAHATRVSDHNPWVKDNRGVGVVRALDVDAGKGGDTSVGRFLADHLVSLGRAGHPALGPGSYVISNRRIASPTSGWAWRAYTGTNPHISHTHVSVSLTQAGYDSTRPWGLLTTTRPVLRLGATGDAVRRLQTLLGVPTDGQYGPKTAAAVTAYQRGQGLTPDGITGPRTWGALAMRLIDRLLAPQRPEEVPDGRPPLDGPVT